MIGKPHHIPHCLPLSAKRRYTSLHMNWLRICGLALLVGAHLTPVTGQETPSPFVYSLPGLEHPAAWSLENRSVSLGMQRAPRWNEEMRPLESVWLGMGWQPFGHRNHTGTRNQGQQTAFGLVLKQDPLTSGWNQTCVDLSASTSTRLSQSWMGSAGLALGVSHWRLDPNNWSWNAQYGAQGYDPTAPTGEANSGTGLTSGWKWNSALSLAAQSTRAPKSGSMPQIKAAVTLRHVLPGRSPQLSPVHGDTVQWLGHWWTEAIGKWGPGQMTWRAWHRGGWQGHSAFGEWGGTVGRTLGQSSRFTHSRTAHVIECGMLFQTTGTLRAVFGWSRRELQCWMGPGWTWGTLWRPPPGWTLALSWRPEFHSGVSLHR